MAGALLLMSLLAFCLAAGTGSVRVFLFSMALFTTGILVLTRNGGLLIALALVFGMLLLLHAKSR